VLPERKGPPYLKPASAEEERKGSGDVNHGEKKKRRVFSEGKVAPSSERKVPPPTPNKKKRKKKATQKTPKKKKKFFFIRGVQNAIADFTWFVAEREHRGGKIHAFHHKKGGVWLWGGKKKEG